MYYYIPLLIVVLSNTFYHICAKSLPDSVNSFAQLTVTYVVAAIVSLILYYATTGFSQNIITQYQNLNWSSFVLGIAIVGLETGFIYMYKAGWDVSLGQTVSSALLAIVLVFVGFLLFKETISLNKIIGIVICMVGLYFLNK